MPDSPATADMRRWVETWKQAGPELAAIRREEVRTMDNVLAVQQLADPPSPPTRILGLRRNAMPLRETMHPQVIGLLQDALDLHTFCVSQGWRSCLIGGLAVQRWAEARVTRDIDITLLTGFGHEERFIDSLLARYAPRRADAREFALKHRVLLLVTSQGIGIDVSLAALPFEESAVERGSLYTFAPGYTMSTCSAEDLMVFKLFASRAIEAPEIMHTFERIRAGNYTSW
jgi:hypothetical protein